MNEGQYTTLIAALQHVPDPRKRCGKRHPWTVLVTLMAAAVASGCWTPASIARWVREHAEALLDLLPPTVTALPSEATLRRMLRTMNLTDVEAHLARWQAQDAVMVEPSPQTLLEGYAIDGKRLRGLGKHGRSCQLVSLVRHRSAAVWAQTSVAEKRDERSALPTLLQGRNLHGVVITVDALHTQRSTARLIRTQGGHYLMVVKRNTAVLYAYLDLLFRIPAIPADHEVWYRSGPSTIKVHGRIETRTLECSTALCDELDWPDVAQVVRRTCERTIQRSGRTTREVSYGITSLSPHEAGPAELEQLWRGHWTIENRVHYVRDVTMQEDAGQAWTGHTGQALAAIRNSLLTLFRWMEWRSIPDALAHYGASIQRAFALIGVQTVRT